VRLERVARQSVEAKGEGRKDLKPSDQLVWAPNLNDRVCVAVVEGTDLVAEGGGCIFGHVGIVPAEQDDDKSAASIKARPDTGLKLQPAALADGPLSK
jgi:hypothetical protein